MIAGVGNGHYWKSRGLSDERTNSIKASDHGFTPYLSHYYINKIRVGFDGARLKEEQNIIPFKGIVNIYIVFEITNSFNNSDYPLLENCLFEAAKLIKNADIDKYGYSGCGIRFGRHGSFEFPWLRQKCNNFWSR